MGIDLAFGFFKSLKLDLGTGRLVKQIDIDLSLLTRVIIKLKKEDATNLNYVSVHVTGGRVVGSTRHLEVEEFLQFAEGAAAQFTQAAKEIREAIK
jgi:hypothetical protein